ncbi:hypothetical protein [Pseudarthrobacter enclensis]|uniref:Uncharacterized protein n=1 Tax=Pseudarthrobacter enclensis TaxID=993070 RepID=A0ABT9RUK7_9MICC|nr:hypothetical protein [Pseudarthrobacter enclensis]MDP9888747.1 hypothetical protein [Pseudarthrobacter enclensis]
MNHMDTAVIRTVGLRKDDGRVKFGADSDRVHELFPLLGPLKVKGLLISPPSLEELLPLLRRDGHTARQRSTA